MKKVWEILKKYAKRYFIDAMSYMALGLFASLLIGTIIEAIAEIPFLFQADVKFPAFSEVDSTPRSDAVRTFLAKCIGKNCSVEQITKGKRNMLTYIEFD